MLLLLLGLQCNSAVIYMDTLLKDLKCVILIGQPKVKDIDVKVRRRKSFFYRACDEECSCHFSFSLI